MRYLTIPNLLSGCCQIALWTFVFWPFSSLCAVFQGESSARDSSGWSWDSECRHLATDHGRESSQTWSDSDGPGGGSPTLQQDWQACERVPTLDLLPLFPVSIYPSLPSFPFSLASFPLSLPPLSPSPSTFPFSFPPIPSFLHSPSPFPPPIPTSLPPSHSPSLPFLPSFIPHFPLPSIPPSLSRPLSLSLFVTNFWACLLSTGLF